MRIGLLKSEPVIRDDTGHLVILSIMYVYERVSYNNGTRKTVNRGPLLCNSLTVKFLLLLRTSFGLVMCLTSVQFDNTHLDVDARLSNLFIYEPPKHQLQRSQKRYLWSVYVLVNRILHQAHFHTFIQSSARPCILCQGS